MRLPYPDLSSEAGNVLEPRLFDVVSTPPNQLLDEGHQPSKSDLNASDDYPATKLISILFVQHTLLFAPPPPFLVAARW